MKNLRTLGAACVLALAMTIPVFAGHIQTPVPEPPRSPEDVASGVTSIDAITEAALSLLESVLALF